MNNFLMALSSISISNSFYTGSFVEINNHANAIYIRPDITYIDEQLKYIVITFPDDKNFNCIITNFEDELFCRVPNDAFKKYSSFQVTFFNHSNASIGSYIHNLRLELEGEIDINVHGFESIKLPKKYWIGKNDGSIISEYFTFNFTSHNTHNIFARPIDSFLNINIGYNSRNLNLVNENININYVSNMIEGLNFKVIDENIFIDDYLYLKNNDVTDEISSGYHSKGKILVNPMISNQSVYVETNFSIVTEILNYKFKVNTNHSFLNPFIGTIDSAQNKVKLLHVNEPIINKRKFTYEPGVVDSILNGGVDEYELQEVFI